MRFNDLAQQENGLEFLLHEACRSAAEAVGAGFAGVLQYRADVEAFVLQAGVGVRARLVGQARIAADLGTTAGLAWHIGQVVHFRHFAAGGRIRASDAAAEHGVRRLVNVPIVEGGEDAFGVLEVGSAEAGEFAQCDLVFLQAVAGSIGVAVERHAGRARRADQAMLVAERRRDQGDGDKTGCSATQDAKKRRQAPTCNRLQQDTQMQDGSG